MTTTTCPGCWDEDCIDCNSGSHTEVAPWSSMPSTSHGRLISKASDKQVAFLVKLGVDHAEADEMTKTKASETIDRLLKEQGPPKPSEKQLKFLQSLLADRVHHYGPEQIENISQRDCSSLIDMLLSAPRKEKVEDKTNELEDGMYRLPDTGQIFKVYRTQNGHQVAKELCDTDDEGVVHETPVFVYRGKTPLRNLTAEHRMTLDQAKEYGAIYGVCCVCSRTLRREESIEAGIGPVCAGRL